MYSAASSPRHSLAACSESSLPQMRSAFSPPRPSLGACSESSLPQGNTIHTGDIAPTTGTPMDTGCHMAMTPDTKTRKIACTANDARSDQETTAAGSYSTEDSEVPTVCESFRPEQEACLEGFSFREKRELVRAIRNSTEFQLSERQRVPSEQVDHFKKMLRELVEQKLAEQKMEEKLARLSSSPRLGEVKLRLDNAALHGVSLEHILGVASRQDLDLAKCLVSSSGKRKFEQMLQSSGSTQSASSGDEAGILCASADIATGIAMSSQVANALGACDDSSRKLSCAVRAIAQQQEMLKEFLPR